MLRPFIHSVRILRSRRLVSHTHALIGMMSANFKKKEGFAQVAQWIALDPDNDTSIYRKFGELSARSLLYLQAELLVLEREIAKIDQRDAEKFASGDLDAKDVASTWEVLWEQCQSGEPEAQERMDLVLKAREKIKEYRTSSWP